MLAALTGSAVEELRLERGGVRIALRRALTPAPGGEPPVPAPAALSAPEPAPESSRTEVRAQWVGVFHRARQLDGPLLASEGDQVESGQALGVIETLGIANDVEAPVRGTLRRFLAEDGQAVEYGEPLAEILPEE
jgi:acetyl-CoA carboxylase biotin carboxyl carrier protein